MRHRIAPITLALVFATLSLSAAAAAQARNSRCSLARAAGTYGFSTSGTIVDVGSRVSEGTITLDAAGNVTGRATSSLNGTVAGEKFSGTYTLNSDCTGRFNNLEIRDLSGNLLLTVAADGTWDDNMRQLRGIFTSATLPDGTSLLTVISIEGRKMVP